MPKICQRTASDCWSGRCARGVRSIRGVSEALKCIKWAGKASADTHLCGSYRSAIKKRERMRGTTCCCDMFHRDSKIRQIFLYSQPKSCCEFQLSTIKIQLKMAERMIRFLLQRPLAVILMACPKCVIKTDIFSLVFLLWFCNHFHNTRNGHR